MLQEQVRGMGWKEWKRSSIPHSPSPLESPPLPLSGVAAKGRTSGNGSASTHCSVCGDSAPDHVHYGSVTCFSCRAFFRRSVSSGVDVEHSLIVHKTYKINLSQSDVSNQCNEYSMYNFYKRQHIQVET